MLHPEFDIVTIENGPRPAGKPDQCFYCKSMIGEPHKEECVCRQKSVVVKYCYEVVTFVPASWTAEVIERHRNKSSWCADNASSEINAMTPKDGCDCPIFTAQFVREATEEDEKKRTDAIKTYADQPV